MDVVTRQLSERMESGICVYYYYLWPFWGCQQVGLMNLVIMAWIVISDNNCAIAPFAQGCWAPCSDRRSVLHSNWIALGSSELSWPLQQQFRQTHFLQPSCYGAAVPGGEGDQTALGASTKCGVFCHWARERSLQLICCLNWSELIYGATPLTSTDPATSLKW